MKWLLLFACACSSTDTQRAPVPRPPPPAPVIAIDAAPSTWPTVDGDKLLSAAEIASLCHIPKLTAKIDRNEGTITEAFDPNPASKALCNRNLEVPKRGKIGAILLVAYPDADWPKQLAKVWGNEYGAINFKAQKTDVYTRRDIGGFTGRYEWSLFETDQEGESQLCTDDQWRTLAKQLTDRL